MLASALALDELERVRDIQRDGQALEAAIRGGLAMTAEGLRALERIGDGIRTRQQLSALLTANPEQDQQLVRDVARAERIARRQRRKGADGTV